MELAPQALEKLEQNDSNLAKPDSRALRKQASALHKHLKG
jgi:hypothetical protein